MHPPAALSTVSAVHPHGAGQLGGAEAIADQFPDTDISVLETVTARHRAIDAWKLTPELEEQSLVNLQKVMEHAGELSRSQWVDFDRLVDNSWAKNAG